VSAIIAYLSSVVPLYPGEVIFTGTPARSGAAAEFWNPAGRPTRAAGPGAALRDEHGDRFVDRVRDVVRGQGVSGCEGGDSL